MTLTVVVGMAEALLTFVVLGGVVVEAEEAAMAEALLGLACGDSLGLGLVGVGDTDLDLTGFPTEAGLVGLEGAGRVLTVRFPVGEVGSLVDGFTIDGRFAFTGVVAFGLTGTVSGNFATEPLLTLGDSVGLGPVLAEVLEVLEVMEFLFSLVIPFNMEGDDDLVDRLEKLELPEKKVFFFCFNPLVSEGD